MEGLEISEVNYSRIVSENRYDSEYFKQIFLDVESYLNKKKHFKLGDKYKVTDGEHGSVVFQDSGIKYLTAENIKKGYVDISKIRFVGEDVDIKNARARVKIGDILISIKGTLGEIAIAENWLLPANMNRDVAIIKPLKKEFSSEYVALFMMSEYGALQSLRGGSGGVQQMITLERLRKFIIPYFSAGFSEAVKELYTTANNSRIKSQQIYSQSENLLLETLGLNNFEPCKEAVNIKTFKESFGSTGRLDAEYYQLKYEDYITLIYSYSNGVEPLSSVCQIQDSNFNPLEKSEYKYIELSNIGKSGDVTGCTLGFGAELPTRARRRVNTNDVIISSIEGSLDSCAVITENYDSALCSTGFYVLTSLKLNPETLLVLFKSEPMQNILKKGCSGTILTAIGKAELEKIPIPLIDVATQKSIQEKVKESSKLRLKSEQLLELAKTAVEKAIEENEDAALSFIENSLILLNEKSI